jgi:hypothetical protein
MVFVFLALIEFAIVNNYMRKSEKFEKLSNKYSAEKGIDREKVLNTNTYKKPSPTVRSKPISK